MADGYKIGTTFGFKDIVALGPDGEFVGEPVELPSPTLLTFARPNVEAPSALKFSFSPSPTTLCGFSYTWDVYLDRRYIHNFRHQYGFPGETNKQRHRRVRRNLRTIAKLRRGGSL